MTWHLIDFLKYNKEKKVTIAAYIYSLYYRGRVVFTKQSKLQSIMGIKGEESVPIESDANIRMARLIARHVNRITTHLPWERKCLVRALTVQKLLHNRKIQSTLYLGVKKENDKMVAHAWLRCGQYCITGGCGEGYTMIEKFRA